MSISTTDPRRVEPGDAPFMPGDRVTYRPRPAGIETVELVEYRSEGWGGWYMRTRRLVGATGTAIRHYFDAAHVPAGRRKRSTFSPFSQRGDDTRRRVSSDG